MPSRDSTHLGAARRHGRRALAELRRLTADSALHWILAHRQRIAQFRRAIKGTRAEAPFAQFLDGIREEATALPPRRRARKARKPRVVRAARARPPAYGTYF